MSFPRRCAITNGILAAKLTTEARSTRRTPKRVPPRMGGSGRGYNFSMRTLAVIAIVFVTALNYACDQGDGLLPTMRRSTVAGQSSGLPSEPSEDHSNVCTQRPPREGGELP